MRRILLSRGFATVTLISAVFLQGCLRSSSSSTQNGPTPGQPLNAATQATAPPAAAEARSLFLFCGAGIRKPVEDINKQFEAESGVRIEPTFTGSGCLLAQIDIAEKGDLYMPGEDFYMQQAVERGHVTDHEVVAYFIPVIMVQRGNPKKIRSVMDLTRPGIRVGMGEPMACAIGDFTEKLVEELKVPADKFRANVVAHFGTAPELGNAVKLKSVDACIQWDSVAALYLDDAQVVPIPVTEQTSSPIPLGVLKWSRHPELAREYLKFVAGRKGQAIFKKHHFTLDLSHPTFPVKKDQG